MTVTSARLVARKDAVELRRDRRLMLAVALTMLLALAAVVATYTRVVDYQRDRSAAEAMERHSWLNQGPRDPHSAAHFAQWAFRPVTAPALLDPGTLPHAGSAIWLEAHARNPAAFRAVEDRVGVLDLGEFSAAWVLQTLAPLLVLVLAAGAVARERERSTLRLLLASGASPATLVRAKAGAMARMAAMIVAPLLLVAAVAVVLAPGRTSGDEVARALLWSVAHTMLLGVAVLVGVAVSARARSTAAALAAVIGLWVVAVTLAPRAAASMAEALYPTPSGTRFWAEAQQEIHDGFNRSGTAEERGAALKADLLRRYGVAQVEDLPISFRGASLDANERFGNRVFERRWAMLHAIEDRQRAAMRWGSLFTPAIAAQNVSAALAGTDNLHARDFATQAEAERQRVVNGLNRNVTVNGVGRPGYQADARLWRSFGPFEPEPVPVARALRQVWPDLLILAAWLAAAGLLARRAGRTLAQEFGR